MGSKLLTNGLISIGNNIVQLLVSLGSGFLIARMLGTNGKGELYLLTQFSSIVQVVFLFGLSTSLLYFIRTAVISVNQALTFSLIFTGVLTAGFAICMYGFPGLVIQLLSKQVNENYILLMFITAQLNILSSFVGYALMYEDAGVKNWSVINLVSNLLYLLILFSVIYVYPFGVKGALWALLLSTCIKTFLLVVPAIKNFVFEIMPWSLVSKIFLYGLGAFISNLFLTGVFRIDVFFLSHYVLINQIGIYSVAVNVSELLLLIPNALGVVLFPHLSGMGKDEQLQTMGQIGRLSFILGLSGTLVLLILSYPFILVIFGRDFINAFIPLLCLLPGLMAMTLNYSYSNFFSSSGQPYIVALSFGIGLVVNIILNLIFVPQYGIFAAAINSSVTYAIITMCFIIAIRLKYQLSYKSYIFPSWNDFLYIAAKVKTYIRP